MLKEKLKVRGDVNIVLCGPDGNIKETREIKNLVVTTGLGWIASRMNNAENLMSHMAAGSGSVAAVAGDTDLGSILGARKALTSTTVTGPAVEYVASFDPGEATGGVEEAGIFTALTSGIMLCRSVFAVINKGAEDTMTITWTITINAGA